MVSSAIPIIKQTWYDKYYYVLFALLTIAYPQIFYKISNEQLPFTLITCLQKCG